MKKATVILSCIPFFSDLAKGVSPFFMYMTVCVIVLAVKEDKKRGESGVDTNYFTMILKGTWGSVGCFLYFSQKEHEKMLKISQNFNGLLTRRIYLC